MFEWLKKLFKKKSPYEDDDFWNNEDDSAADRRTLDLNDPDQMEMYVRTCCEQMLEATSEIDQATVEYRFITQRLTDMEEIEQLPQDKRKPLNDCAAKLLELEDTRVNLEQRKTGMPESQYRLIERNEGEMVDTISTLEENENYKSLVRQDLQNLEGEKISYKFRKYELLKKERITREFTIITCFASIMILITLCILQYQFEKSITYGYLIVVAVFAVILTTLFIIFNNARTERHIVEKRLNVAIETQNKVKIRYVNTTNVIESIYMRFNVNSANELRYIWDRFIKEKKERESAREADEKIAILQKDLMDKLRAIRLNAPELWLDQAPALLDSREMVEIRHELIGKRQSLRKRIEYNEDSRQAAKAEVTELIKLYPAMAPLIINIVEEYDN